MASQLSILFAEGLPKSEHNDLIDENVAVSKEGRKFLYNLLEVRV